MLGSYIHCIGSPHGARYPTFASCANAYHRGSIRSGIVSNGVWWISAACISSNTGCVGTTQASGIARIAAKGLNVVRLWAIEMLPPLGASQSVYKRRWVC